jgi:hypothetical protein
MEFKEYTEAVMGLTLKEIIGFLQTFESENRALKKENRARREMWEELKKMVVHDGMKDYEMSELEEQYLECDKPTLPEPVQKIADNQKIMDRLGENNEH